MRSYVLRRRLLPMVLAACLLLAPVSLKASADSKEGKACVIGAEEYDTLAEALTAVKDGETIRLLRDIAHGTPVEIKDNDVTFDLNGKTLLIDTSHIPDSHALTVTNCTVGLLSSGGNQFDVKGGSIGVLAHNGAVTVRYAEAVDEAGLGIGVGAEAGGQTIVLGDAKGRMIGAHAHGAGSTVTVHDDAMSTGENGRAVDAVMGGHVRVKNAISYGANSTGVLVSGHELATPSSAAVTGNVTAGKIGVNIYGYTGVTATIGGNVTVTSDGSEGIQAGMGARVEVAGSVAAVQTGVYSNGSEVTVAGNVTSDTLGVHATGGGTAAIGGTVTASGYIKTGTTDKTETNKEASTTKAGYHTYTDGTSTVWVRNTEEEANVCAIGSTEYATLDAALLAAPVLPQSATIRLLQDIDYDDDLIIDGKIIVFDLGAFDLRVGKGISGNAGLEVNNAHVAYTESSVGGFYVTGYQYGVKVYSGSGKDASASVSGATATADEGIGLHVQGAHSTAVVDGPVTATHADRGMGMYIGDGTAKIYGNVSAAKWGALCTGGETEISGNVTATAADGYGVEALGDAQATVGGNVTVYGARSTGVRAGDRSTVIVSGKVKSTDTDGVGVEVFGTNGAEYGLVKVYQGVTGVDRAVRANFHGKAVIFGPVSSTGENGVGVEAEAEGQITVTGNVTAPDTSGVIGVLAGPGVSGEFGPGRVTVNGNVTACQGLKAEEGSIQVNGSVSAKDCGAEAISGEIRVTGNVKSDNSYGVKVNESEVTIDGIIDAPSYIDMSGTNRPKDSVPYTDQGGYRVYTGYNNNIVRVGNNEAAVPPAVTTSPVTAVTTTGATFRGVVTAPGSSGVNARGFVYGASPALTIDSGTVWYIEGALDPFEAAVGGFSPGVTYYVRAFARNSAGVGYGVAVSFTTGTPPPAFPPGSTSPPTVVTNGVSGVTASGASLSGSVTSDGGEAVTERGFVYGRASDPALGGEGVVKAAAGSGAGSFTASLDGLFSGVTYHVRAYAVNSRGTSYGADVSFATGTPRAGEIGYLDASGAEVSSPYGNVVLYTDPDGKTHILGLGVIVGSGMKYVSRGAGKYEIVNNAKPFDDIAGHWAKNDVDFSSARLLFNGVAPRRFAPDSAMTRGMLAAVLGRMYGIDPAHYTGASFGDVPQSAYYAPYVKWAAENGILFGVSALAFEPERAVTRQEMAVMLHRFMGHLGLELVRGESGQFQDAQQIGAWAREGVLDLRGTGILSGKPGDLFEPDSLSTRAETAAVLRRLVEYILK